MRLTETIPGYAAPRVLRLPRVLTTPLALVGFASVLSAVLGFFLLAEKSFWLDEALSVAIAQMNGPDQWDLMSTWEPNQALYYVVLDLWLNLGTGEFVVRSLSVLLALGCVPVVYAIGSRLYGAKVGVTAAFVMAINGFFVQYSQEARGYTLRSWPVWSRPTFSSTWCSDGRPRPGCSSPSSGRWRSTLISSRRW